MAQIHDLVLAGDVSGLENYLLAQTNVVALVNEVDDWRGCTPLFIAVDQRPVNYEIVRLLLEAGADPNYVKVENYSRSSSDADFETDEITADFGFEAHMSNIPTEFRTSTVSKIVKTGDLALVKLFKLHGADLISADTHGYTSVLHAIYSENDPTEVVDYLLRLGISPDTKSAYGETAIASAMRTRWYRTVERLISFGADESPIGWSRLIRATTLGTPLEVEHELSNPPDLEETDSAGSTALQVGLRRGNEAIVNLLLAAGASIEGNKPDGNSPLHCAVEGRNPSLVLRMLKAGCSVEEKDRMGDTALNAAVASGNLEIVRVLLEHGANPTKGETYESIISNAKDKRTIMLLLEAGADPAELDSAGRRTLVGLSQPNESPLASISREKYMQARYERQGLANPEDLTEPFRLAMIRSGCNAYVPRRRFDDMPDFACGRSWSSRPPQVWCFDRLGQSFTLTPDGRTIMVAGEHEDSYDPDFCIYNDVTVFYPDGQIQVFGYPYQVFEPTDFHTATLIGNYIWIIGGLGYPDQRDGLVPVYRLDIRDYSIDRISTAGEVPARFHGHRAIVRDGGEIEIRVGSTCGLESDEDESISLRLNTATRIWTREVRPRSV